jgi:hypothetical protein
MRHRAILAALAVLALMLGSCAPENSPSGPPRMPNGSRETLRPGYWRGLVKTTLVNFYIDRVSGDGVAVHINGGVLSPQKDSPQHPVSFTDRPKTCQRSVDGLSFDCLRYRSMHIDNGFLCGYYTLAKEIFPICFQPRGVQ